MPILLRKMTVFAHLGHRIISGCNLISTEVSVRVRYGALQVRSLRKNRVNLYRKTPLISNQHHLSHLFISRTSFYLPIAPHCCCCCWSMTCCALHLSPAPSLTSSKAVMPPPRFSEGWATRRGMRTGGFQQCPWMKRGWCRTIPR